MVNVLLLRKSLLRVVGSFLSGCIGWIGGTIAVALNGIVLVLFGEQSWEDLWSGVAAHFLMIGGFVIPIWLLVLLPLYVLLPRSSRLWRTPVCVALGAISGAAIVVLYLLIGGGPIAVWTLWFFPIEGAIVGGLICLFGAMTSKYFDAGGAAA